MLSTSEELWDLFLLIACFYLITDYASYSFLDKSEDI